MNEVFQFFKEAISSIATAGGNEDGIPYLELSLLALYGSSSFSVSLDSDCSTSLESRSQKLYAETDLFPLISDSTHTISTASPNGFKKIE